MQDNKCTNRLTVLSLTPGGGTCRGCKESLVPKKVRSKVKISVRNRFIICNPSGFVDMATGVARNDIC